MKLFLLFFVLVEVSMIGAQSLYDAISDFDVFSNLRNLINANPNAASSLLANITSGEPRTILVPNNDAFENFLRITGTSVNSLSSSDLEDTFNYHSLEGALSSNDVQKQRGLLSNTGLRTQRYDNRGLQSNGAKKPQVVLIASTGSASDRKIKVKRAVSVDVKSGRGQEITLDPAPGKWSGGNFFMVDGFLTLPVNQTDTMKSQGLTSFVTGLARTNVTAGTNAAPNFTCVCPNNAAFRNIPYSNSTANLTSGRGSLLATLTRHGLPDSYYTINFTDGALIYSQNGYPILVTHRNGSIFLNDAKLIGMDFIANSGAVHALDRIMGFLNTTTNVTTPANADIYRNPANIPTPPSKSTPTSSTTAAPTASGSSTTKASTAVRWKPSYLRLMLGVFIVEAWRCLMLE